MDESNAAHFDHRTKANVHQTCSHQATHGCTDTPSLDTEHDRSNKRERRGKEDWNRTFSNQLEKKSTDTSTKQSNVWGQGQSEVAQVREHQKRQRASERLVTHFS